ncbi:MAG: TIGR02281 family clan AA aspartic protease [Pirellula sp.]
MDSSSGRCGRLVKLRTGAVALFFIAILCFQGSQCDGQDKEALAKLDQSLKEMGLRRSGVNLMLEEESQLQKNLLAEAQIRKEMKKFLPEFQKMEAEDLRRAAELQAARGRVAQIQVLLAQGLPVNQHNQLVAENNVLVNLVNNYEMDKVWPEQLRQSRAKRNKILERYTENMLEARKAANQLQEKWQDLERDDEYKEIVEELSTQLKQSVTPGPSRGFRKMISDLEKLEEKVLSDVIPLEVFGKNTFTLRVTVNGEETVDMVLDSGAGIVLLPSETAKKLDIETTDASPDIQLVLADGRIVIAKRVSIPVVRVGRFEVNEVEAAILPPELVNAEPLLGMSFLKNFQFKVDSEAKTLTMSEIEGVSGSAGQATKTTPKKKKK